MIHFSALDVAALVALLTWPAIALVAAALGISVWLGPGLRQRTFWRRAAVAAVAVLALDTLVASPFIAEIAKEQVRAWKVRYYTYHLEAPRSFDGTQFPAGSVVELAIDPPHRLDRGSIPAPTRVLGLELIGDFSVGETAAGAFIKRGTLASAATINIVPCGPGRLERDADADEVSCTLARDLTIAGMVLGTGTSTDIWFSPLGGPPIIKTGTLAQSVHVADLGCAIGPVEYAAYRLRCLLDDDQVVRGFPLAGGHLATLSTDSDHAQSVDEGTLAAPLSILGVTLPAGARIEFVGHYTAGDLSSGPLRATDSVSFILPQGSAVAVEGVLLEGEVEIEFTRAGVEAAIWDIDGRGGGISFAGRQHRLGFLDSQRHRWRFDGDIGRAE